MYWTTKRRSTYPAQALMALGLLLWVALGWGQVGPQPLGVTSDVPTINRAMIKLRQQTPRLLVLGTATNPSYIYLPAGRWQIQTSDIAPDGGNPTRTGDEDRLIASLTTPMRDSNWGVKYTSKVTIAVDTDPTDARQGFYQDPHQLAEAYGTVNNPANLINIWPLAPTPGVRDIAGEFLVPADDDRLTLQVAEWIRVRQVFTVIGDMVRMEFIITNTSTQRHDIGLRILIDAGFGGASPFDGSRVFLPDGSSFATERTIPDAQTATVPDWWVSYDNPQAPTMAVRGLLRTSEVFDPGIANSAAGMPDQIIWGQMRNIGVDQQYYTNTNARAPLEGEDWAYAVWWAPRAFSPGESRRYVTYYGMGTSASDYEAPYALMAFAPYMLQTHPGDNPATPDRVEEYYWVDDQGRSPFPVSVYMDNFGAGIIFDASARIRLPQGFELASGESASKSVGTIARNEIKSISWNVLATTARPGQTEIKFTGPQGKVVTRKINLPALPVLNPWPEAPTGLEMVSVPYEFSNNDAEWVFQSLGSLLPGGPAALIRYDPRINDYRWFPEAEVATITPGLGYWLLNRNRTVINLPPDATPVDNTRNYLVALRTGWNQIGNPFTSTIRLDQVRVAGTYGGEWSFTEAVARNLLLPTLFAYDPSANKYTWKIAPEETYLEPFMGYWILARENISLIFPPPTLIPAAPQMGAPKPEAARVDYAWKVDVFVQAPGMPATQQTLAAHPQAETRLDRFDVPQPPPSLQTTQVYLQSAFYSGPSALGLPFIVDTRSSQAGTQEWHLVIKTNAIRTPVTVTWPSLEQLPAHLIATLVDEAAGQRRYMRTTTSYTYQTGDEPSERVLKIIVQPRTGQGLAIANVNAVPSGQGIMLTFGLSVDAVVDVRIRNIAGIVISEVVRDRAASAGQNTVLWNKRSSRGLMVPSGRYLCEITARSPETGQEVSVVQPVYCR